MRQTLPDIITMFKPNMASLGYALFLAINATGVWGGFFPFLPLNFQTQNIILGFFIAQSLAFFAVCAVSVGIAYLLPGFTRNKHTWLAIIPYLMGWFFLIGAMYLSSFADVLAVVAGVFMGAGSAGFYIFWQRLFAGMDPEEGSRKLIAGSAYAALFYFALYAIPGAITVFLVPVFFLPAFAICLVVSSRKVDLNQPMFQDVPTEHAPLYKKAVGDFWRSAMSVAALAFAAGIMRSLAIIEPSLGMVVNLLSMAGLLLAAVALMVIWVRGGARLNVPGMYRFVFPFLISAMILMPLISGAYSRGLSAVCYAVFNMALMLANIQSAQAARDRGLNPIFIYCLFCSLIYGFHDIGFVGIAAINVLDLAGDSLSMVVALAAVYILGLMFFFGTGGFKAANIRDAESDTIELVAPVSPSLAATASESTVLELGHGRKKDALPDNDEGYKDKISKRIMVIKAQYGLSTREAEVADLVAHGYTVAKIAEILFVSENTAHTHVKRIYGKLDIHKKSELLELVNTEDSPLGK